MDATKVVDASAIAAIIFHEAEAEGVLDRLGEAKLVAPTLLSFELANIGATKCRRYRNQRENLIEAMAWRAGFRIEELPVDYDAVLALALETKLTAYDASYLWLALRLDAELVTLDAALGRAWTALAGRYGSSAQARAALDKATASATFVALEE